MKKGGGKAKGSAFERQVCKALSLWVSHGKNEDLFWRSAMSGGRATVSKKKGKLLNRQAGDISAVAPEGHALTDLFYVECKFVKKLGVSTFLFKRTGLLNQFWNVAHREARQHGRAAMLIAKENKGGVLVFCDERRVQGFPWACAAHIATRISLKTGARIWVMEFEAMVSSKFTARYRTC